TTIAASWSRCPRPSMSRGARMTMGAAVAVAAGARSAQASSARRSDVDGLRMALDYRARPARCGYRTGVENDPTVMAELRQQLGRAMAQWHPSVSDVRRFHLRLQATLERVKADASPLTLIEQTGTAIAEAATPFEAFAHLAVLEVYAKVSTDERLLRYCKLVADVFRLLGEATRAQSGRSELTAD